MKGSSVSQCIPSMLTLNGPVGFLEKRAMDVNPGRSDKGNDGN